MNFLLDTCFIFELIKKKPNPGVINWVTDKDESNLYLSVLTLGEIKKGISKLSESKKKSELTDWLYELEKRFEGRIIPLSLEIALLWGKIQGELEVEGKPMPSLDALIACSAIVKNLIVVTHNGKDMERSKVEIIDPWE